MSQRVSQKSQIGGFGILFSNNFQSGCRITHSLRNLYYASHDIHIYTLGQFKPKRYQRVQIRFGFTAPPKIQKKKNLKFCKKIYSKTEVQSFSTCFEKYGKNIIIFQTYNIFENCYNKLLKEMTLLAHCSMYLIFNYRNM